MNLWEPTRFSGHGGSRLGFKALGFLGLLPQGLGLGGFGCRGCQSWSARDEGLFIGFGRGYGCCEVLVAQAVHGILEHKVSCSSRASSGIYGRMPL